ncbi:MAG: beta-ketoacyl-ACP synthase 3 [Mycobacteriales bacterium]
MSAPAGEPGRPAGPGWLSARILGLGHYQPARVVTNGDLIARGVDTTDDWVRSRVGVRERRFADPDESVVDMAEAAASKAIANAGLSPDDVDLVITATCTMPTSVPTAAPQLATRLGIDSPGAYDVNSGCSGFVYAFNAAAAAVHAGQARHALVVASERFSGFIDFDDRATCVILGDGAGAAVVGPSERAAVGPVTWGSAGDLHDTVVIEPQTQVFRQEGQAVYRWATTKMVPVALEACRRAGVAPSELGAFVPHQANLRIIDMIATKLGIAGGVVARDIVESGNTSAATIPLAMSKMVERGEIPSGSPVLLLGFGSGLSFAGQVVTAP